MSEGLLITCHEADVPSETKWMSKNPNQECVLNSQDLFSSVYSQLEMLLNSWPEHDSTEEETLSKKRL